MLDFSQFAYLAVPTEDGDKDALQLVQKYGEALRTFRKLQANHEQARRQA